MDDWLDQKQTAIGRKADFLQSMQVAQTLANIKMAGIVDRAFGPQGAAFRSLITG